MRKSQKLKKHRLPHLTREDVNNPLFTLVELCCSETDLHHLRNDTLQFIRSTACQNSGFDEEDYGTMFFFYLRFLKHIELLYVLMHRYPDWSASTDSPFYRLEITGYSYTIVDDDFKGSTKLEFWKLGKEEVLDVSVFMRSFFKFRTLRQWQMTVDDLVQTVFSRETFSEYDNDAFQVYEYLEKLAEALFLAYEIHGKEYMLMHCADRFGINKKKLVDR